MDNSPAAELDEFPGQIGLNYEQQPFVVQNQQQHQQNPNATENSSAANAKRKKRRQQQQQQKQQQQHCTATRVRGQPIELSGPHIGISSGAMTVNNNHHGASAQLQYPASAAFQPLAADLAYRSHQRQLYSQNQPLQSTMPRSDRQKFQIPPPPLGPPPPPPSDLGACRDSFASAAGSAGGENPYSVASIEPEQLMQQHQQIPSNSMLLYGSRRQQQQPQQLYLMSGNNAGMVEYGAQNSLLRHQIGTVAPQTTPPGQYMPNGSGSTIDNSCKPLCSDQLGDPQHPVQRGDGGGDGLHRSGKLDSGSALAGKRRLVCFGLLVSLVALLLVALVVCAVLARRRQTCLADLQTRKSSLFFGGFDPNSPPILLEDRRVYRVDLPGRGFWSAQLECERHVYAVVNVTLPYKRPVGLYMRRNNVPTLVQRDFFHRLENVQDKNLYPDSVVRFLTPGDWYLTLANDQQDSIAVEVEVFRTERELHLTSCLNQCSHRGYCRGSTCTCFQGFMGPDCSVADALEICSGNGYLDRGVCRCTAQWKGPECEVPWSECPDPLCSGNGRCQAGRCECFEGFGGDRCQNVTCSPPDCSGRGVCQVSGRCRCFSGWSGTDCSTAEPEGNKGCNGQQRRLCEGRGRFVDGRCQCFDGYSGDNCETESCTVLCQHGRCRNGQCSCDPGWWGVRCNLRACDPLCEAGGHGVCVNGTCRCAKGWNGPECSIDGCPQSCNNRGNCRRQQPSDSSSLAASDWHCVCLGINQWRGDACQHSIEKDCSDGVDNDGDGLVDCFDPDCCHQTDCATAATCKGGAIAKQVLLSESPLPAVSSFEKRVKFLVGKESVQLGYSPGSIDPKQISVLMGRLFLPDGSQLIGSRQEDARNPSAGHSLSRPDGSFTLVVSASGGSGFIALSFRRSYTPNRSLQAEFLLSGVPVGAFLNLGNIVLTPADAGTPMTIFSAPSSIGSSSSQFPQVYSEKRTVNSGFSPMLRLPLPTVQQVDGHLLSTILSNGIILERQVIKLSIPVPDSPFSLVYSSSRAAGFKELLPVKLLSDSLPTGLAEVLCQVSIGGSLQQKRFHPKPNLTHIFEWDRMDPFGRPLTGLVEARVSVGFRFSSCSRIVWQTRATLLPGAELIPSRLGQWSIDKVHAYDYEAGVLHMGDGSTEYLSQRPWIMERLPVGSGAASLSTSRAARWSLAVTATGHVIFADPVARLVSILSPSSGDSPQTLLRLEAATHPGSAVLYLANDPSSPSDRAAVYLSDPGRREILRLPLNLAPPIKLTLPTESSPRALTIDANGVLYYVDTYSIMRVSTGASNVPKTIVAGNGGALAGLEPWPCRELDLAADNLSKPLPIRWPVDLAINPLDNSLHFIDDQSVFRLSSESGRVELVAGRPPHCPAANLNTDAAVNQRLRSPRSIEFTAQGELLIAQADGLWVMRSDGRLQAFPVAELPSLASSDSVSDISVGPQGQIYLTAGPSMLKLRPNLPSLSTSASSVYRVSSRDASEIFTFSHEGKHLGTEDAVTGTVKYRFEHSTYDTSLGAPVLKIRMGNNATFELRNEYHNASIRSPSGRECQLEYSELGQARIISCQGGGRYSFEYESRGGGVTSATFPSGGRWLFRYTDAGRISETINPTGRVDQLLTEATAEGVRVRSGTASVEFDGSGAKPVGYRRLISGDLPALQSVAESNLPNGSRRLTAHLTCRNCSIKFVTSGTTASGNGGGTTRWRRTIRLGRSSDGLDASALKHRSEWVYTSGQMSLMVNSRPTLGVTFNRHQDQRLTAAYFGYDSNHLSASSAAQHLFSIVYNSFGQPLSVVPNAQKSFFRPVYFKYTDRNQLSEMRWADKPRTASESTAREGWLQRQYDSAGRLVSEARNFSSGSAASSDDLAVHRFGYSDNSSMPGRISDPAGQTYRFERDPSTGGLGRLVTPTGTIRLRAHSSLSSNRLLYWPWLGTARAAVFHYNADEALESVLYPSRQRRLVLSYRQDGRISEQNSYDGERSDTGIRFAYDLASKQLAVVTTKHSSPACSVTQKLSYASQLLPVQETVEFDAACGLASVIHRPVYHGDQLFTASMSTSIGGHTAVLNTTRHLTRGYVTKLWGSGPRAYTVTRSEHFIELSDSISTLKISFDSLGRLVDTMLHVASARVFVLSVHAYSVGRVQELAHRIGKDDDNVFTNVMYVRDLRSRVIRVDRKVPGASVDREEFEYKSNGRFASRVSQNRTYSYSYDSRGLPTSVGKAEYMFDSDGFLARRRDLKSLGAQESFKFDASGKLLTAQCINGASDCYRIRYLYDGRQRLVARQDMLTPTRDFQLLYADPLQPNRITHVYYPRKKQLLAFTYEDRAGRLVAVDLLSNSAGSSQRFYVACDRLGSPLAVFNSTGDSVLRQDYSNSGRLLNPSINRLPFRFPFGYLGGLHDADTELVWLPSRSDSRLPVRVYDPVSGLWAAPDYSDLFQRLARAQQSASASPQLLDLYTFDPWQGSEDDVYSPNTVGRPDFWLRAFNLDLPHLLAEPALRSIQAATSKLTSPLTSFSTGGSVLVEALAAQMRGFNQGEISRGSSSTNFDENFLQRIILNATKRNALPHGYLATWQPASSIVNVFNSGASDFDSARASVINNTRLTGCATRQDDDRWLCRFQRDAAPADAGPPIRLEGELETFEVTGKGGA
ncbi:hypothetical protein BOX15_Mlig024160g3 [Macrostomum lignano]|uniref:EGF-like domain-containing protein n=1 Tax=Macrostomum lignano TaxID=282301 RepID=A0A267H3F9_9PLAT|nr:hypothetical protein BOX15_Mlig024160g3 [Macrostomum lignano]